MEIYFARSFAIERVTNTTFIANVWNYLQATGVSKNTRYYINTKVFFYPTEVSKVKSLVK